MMANLMAPCQRPRLGLALAISSRLCPSITSRVCVMEKKYLFIRYRRGFAYFSTLFGNSLNPKEIVPKLAKVKCKIATKSSSIAMGEISTKDTPREIFLKDYKPTNYAFERVDLNFLLGEHQTIVKSIINVAPRRETNGNHPLVLDGRDLKLLSVKINGEAVKSDNLNLTSRHLTLSSPPLGPFTLEVDTEIHPEKNLSLEGLYKSGENFCTQCEAEGFRKITFFQDRPDIMSIYTTRIEADKAKYPVLLSNGNLVEHGDLEDGRHYAVWEDPFKKPSYLFALVAGQLVSRDDTFTTCSGRQVQLRIWTPAQDVPKTAHAMRSLKSAMKWDEDVFGLQYDLDLFNIVAVPDFNMGAMENKSLNIFNSKLVLASPETATDSDYSSILGVIGHEYFHNWTGNRFFGPMNGRVCTELPHAEP